MFNKCLIFKNSSIHQFWCNKLNQYIKSSTWTKQVESYSELCTPLSQLVSLIFNFIFQNPFRPLNYLSIVSVFSTDPPPLNVLTWYMNASYPPTTNFLSKFLTIFMQIDWMINQKVITTLKGKTQKTSYEILLLISSNKQTDKMEQDFNPNFTFPL